MSTTPEREHVDPSCIFVAPDGNGNRCIWYADVEHGLPIALLTKSDAKADGFESLAAVVALHHGRAWRDRVAPDADLCGLCKQPATGLASIDTTRYCHGDEDASPTCYEVACWRETGRVSSPMDMDAEPGRCTRGLPGCSDDPDTTDAASSIQPMPDPYKVNGMVGTMTDPYRGSAGSDTADKPCGALNEDGYTTCDFPVGHDKIPDGEGELWQHAYRFDGKIAGWWNHDLRNPPAPSPAPEDERETDCDCGHPIWWHHETKGCTSNAHGGRLCWCQAQPEALQATHDAALRARVAGEITTERDRITLGSTVDFRAGMRFAADVAARVATKAVS